MLKDSDCDCDRILSDVMSGDDQHATGLTPCLRDSVVVDHLQQHHHPDPELDGFRSSSDG